jgi:ribosomal protein S7
VLKWAREHGCPWNERTCYYAAEGGHIEVLRWARENGAPWTEITRRRAAEKGYVEP